MLSRPRTSLLHHTAPTSWAALRWASSLVLAHHREGTLRPGTLHAVTAAKRIGDDITILVAGAGTEAVAEAASKIEGVTGVLHTPHPAYTHSLTENLSALVVACQKAHNFTHIFAAADSFGKSVIPHVAGCLDVAAVSEVTDICAGDVFVRPIYAGNAMATIKSLDKVKVLSIRTTCFDKASMTEAKAAPINTAPTVEPADLGLSSFVHQDIKKSDRPELTSAPVVVSGGRGMKSGEGFAMLEKLADKLGGAVGASRAAVDAGMVSNDIQVGQTGKVVAPGLYIAVGISGAIQHLAGMKDSKVIVAINKDPDAPIFQVSDYGIADDLFKVLPELTDKI